MSDRCKGECCRSFSLPYSPEDLGRMRAALASEGEEWPEGLDYPQDAPTLLSMLVYLGAHTNSPVARMRPEDVRPEGFELRHWYTCTHLQPNGDCGNYENRPAMCSLYPYEGVCRWADCEWEAGCRPVTDRMLRLQPDEELAAVPDERGPANDHVHLPVLP